MGMYADRRKITRRYGSEQINRQMNKQINREKGDVRKTSGFAGLIYTCRVLLLRRRDIPETQENTEKLTLPGMASL